MSLWKGFLTLSVFVGLMVMVVGLVSAHPEPVEVAETVPPQSDHCQLGPDLNNPYSNDIYSVAVYEGNPYSGGWFHARRSFNGNWGNYGGGVTGGGAYTLVGDMITHDGNLILGGAFFQAGSLNTNNIAGWDNANFFTLGSGLNDEVTALVEWQGDIVAGGTFTADGAGTTTLNRIAVFRDGAWKPLGTGFTGAGGAGFTTEVWDLAVYNGDLVAAGRFEMADGQQVDGLALWDGTQWNAIGTLRYNTTLGVGTALGVWDGKLYVSGYFNRVGTMPALHIAAWDGTDWETVGTEQNWHALAMVEFDGDLYAAGPNSYTIDGEDYDVARWDGTQWHAIGQANGLVNDFWVDGNKLYIGGSYNVFNGELLGLIITWECTTPTVITLSQISAPTQSAWLLLLFAGMTFMTTIALRQRRVASTLH